MHLIQLLIPTASRKGKVGDIVSTVLGELTERFGGATAYVNSPAKGLWADAGSPEEDRIVVVEVMVEDLDRTWWRQYRSKLEMLLKQEELMVRTLPAEKL